MTALVTLVAFVLMGHVVVSAIRSSDAGPVGESGLRLLTSWALALALVSTWTAASLLVPSVAFGGMAVALLVLGLCVRRRSEAPLAPPLAAVAPLRASRALVVLAVVAFAVAAFVLASRLGRRPDGQADASSIWNLRARLLVREPGDTATFAIGAHPDYPLLLPGLVAAGWTLFSDAGPWVSGVIAALFLAIATAGILVAVRPRRGTSVAILAAIAYVAMPQVVQKTAWRYADVPISAYFVLAVGWLASAYEHPTRSRSALVLTGLCASLAVWTKNEGVFQVVALGLVLALRPPVGTSRGRALSSYLGGAAPFLCVLVAFKAGLAPDSEYVAAATPGQLIDRLSDGSRYVTVARYLFGEVTRWSHWAFLLPAAMLLAAFLPRRGSADVPVARCVGLVALAYVAIYLVTPLPLAWQLENSIDRLLLQLCPALFVAVALRIAPPVSPSRAPSPSDARRPL